MTSGQLDQHIAHVSRELSDWPAVFFEHGNGKSLKTGGGGPKIGLPQNGWIYVYFMENPLRLGRFRGTTIFGHLQMDVLNMF